MLAQVLKGFRIVVDPGHGGKDAGAVDPKNAKEADKLYTEEEDINLLVGLKLQTKLTARGGSVKITRVRDEYPTLPERCNIANNFKANIFISIHCNSAGAREAQGIETLVHSESPRGKKLGKCIQEELIKATGAVNRGVKYRDELYVLKGTNMPAALVELGFITNPAEERKLTSAVYQNKLVDAIVRGVIRYKRGK